MVDPRPSRRRYEIALWIDRRVGPLLCTLLLGAKRLFGGRRTPAPPEEVSRILLLKMWGMGSIVLASPLLAKLRSRYPTARIDFVSLRENEAILGLYREVDRTIAIELGRGIPHFLGETLRTIRAIRRERYDLLLDLEFFTRFSAIFSFLARARWSHGFSAKGNWRGKLHDIEVPFNAYNHVALNFLTLLDGDYRHPVEAEQLSGSDVLPQLVPGEEAWQSCRSRLAADPAWRGDEAIVVVNPNAGDMAVERRWPMEQMAELLRHLGEQRDANIVLIGSAEERPYVESLVRSAKVESRVVNLAGRNDVAELVGLLANAAVVVTNDSGPMHIACAVGASTVALFGPETPTLYGPLRAVPGQRHIVHYLKLACSPCMFVHDNKVLSCWFAQARCMTGIAPRRCSPP
jgi:lipopolysaccharide heptosyltransferase II